MMKQYNFIAEVQSHSDPNKHYTIKMDENGRLSCNCPAWVYNIRKNRTCKHVDEIIRAGFSADHQGKLIVGKSDWSGKVPIFCKNYPEQCDSCRLRFICYTERNPEFMSEQLIEAGVINANKI